MKITNEMSLYLRFLHQDGHVSCKESKQRYPNYALRSIYQHAKKIVTVEMPVDRRNLNKGDQKRLLSVTKGNCYGIRNICKMQEDYSLVK